MQEGEPERLISRGSEGREDKLLGEGEKNMENRKIEEKTTKDIRIDAGLHQLLKLEATKRSMTIKTLLEGYLAELLAVESEE